MKQMAVTQFEHEVLMIVALFIFLVFFISMTIFVYQKSRKKHYVEISRLPLEEAQPHE